MATQQTAPNMSQEKRKRSLRGYEPGLLFIEDPRSPQCRCIRTILEMLNVKCQTRTIGIDNKHEKHDPDFIKLSPRENVPVLVDDDFCLAESHAIATYLCNKYEDQMKPVEKMLYPIELKARARVDQVLLASAIVDTMINSFLNVQGVAYKGGRLKLENEKDVPKALRIASRFLAYNGNTYIASDHFTLADIFMATPLLFLEKMEPRMESSFFSRFKPITEWLKRVKSHREYFCVHNEPTESMARAFNSKLKHQKFIKPSKTE